MWISEINLQNFRCFANASVQLSQGINLIIGPNNSGKSTLLKSILWLQQGFYLRKQDLRLSKTDGIVELKLQEVEQFFADILPSEATIYSQVSLSSNGSMNIQLRSDVRGNFSSIQKQDTINYSISNQAPQNFIYPYLSKRKVVNFSEEINLQTAFSIMDNLSNLYAKIDDISNPQKPANKQYVESCQDILGFQIAAIPSPNGKQAAYIVSDYENIPLDMMGDGISSLLGLIVDLCFAKNKLFVIEEPENDIHPKALKSLLSLIAKKSENNQFIITTHSNIVAKYLGAEPKTKLFKVTMQFQDYLPTSQVEEVDNTPEARRKILEELGYDFWDFDLWSGWLILEESSAERIIRDYLIPWFVPDLKGRLRTYSANSLSEVETKFRDFDNLFVFLHLQPIYKNLAWVIVDAGDEEAKIIEKLKSKYTLSGWNDTNFLQFSEHDFERYYPAQFQAQVDTILQMPGGKNRQKCKKALLYDVIKWMNEKPEEAKIEFQKSALEVIEILKTIQFSLTTYSSQKLN
ncbi:AAA family ATPase [Nostoc sp. FACHB-87]|uniref:ATP-dependent nuclease n=1 Tax=Nostocaceae TaxID=1162 RepID=UPI001682D26A|nr:MULTISPECIES: ATP-binding protein [Nostocaceae]MBD2452758.1 AAA family ATPase [Nostoc sp. FACHB-87]MBD2473689.1 AAA family ATPase [Anabaena sp. FACHB-83]